MAWGIIAIGASAIAYLAITKCFFFADDFIDLYALGNGSLRAFLLTSGGGHLEPVRNVVFLAWWMVFGHEPAGYFWPVLAMHVAVVALVYLIALRCTQRPSVAGLVALLFGTCRTHAGTLAWLSVAGQVLATLLVALALLDITDRIPREARVTFIRVAWWATLLAMAGMCFGTGTAIAITFPVVLLILLPSGHRRPAPFVVAVSMSVFVLSIWAITFWGSLPSSATATLTPHSILQKMVLPTAKAFVHLFAAGTAGLVLGPWYNPAAYPSTLTNVAVISFFGLVGLALYQGTGPRRRLLAGLALLACATYGTVSLARAPAYLELRPNWDMARVGVIARYHYTGQMLLALLLAVAAGTLVARWRRLGVSLPVLAPVAAVVILVGIWRAPPPVDLHTAQRLAVTRAMKGLRTVAARHPKGSLVRVPNRGWNNGLGLLLGSEHLPGLAALYIAFSDEDEIDERPIRFEARSDAQLRARASGGRIARLLVPPSAETHPDGGAGPTSR